MALVRTVMAEPLPKKLDDRLHDAVADFFDTRDECEEWTDRNVIYDMFYDKKFTKEQLVAAFIRHVDKELA